MPDHHTPPDPSCEACQGRGVVACWSPGGLCSTTVCELCGPCRQCGPHRDRPRSFHLAMTTAYAAGSAGMGALTLAIVQAGGIAPALAPLLVALALAAAAGAESRDL